MANTLVLLEKVTVGAAGAASITFSNIPQTGYNDLVLKFSARSTQTGGYSDDLNLNFNGTASVLSDKLVYGTGAAVASSGYSAQTNIWVTSAPNSSTTTSTFGNAELYIPNYNSTTTYKSFSLDGVTENNATNALGSLTAGLYSSNSAITSIKLQLGSGSFVQYSTFSLYGVSNVSTTPLVAPKATGGDIIQTDGTYWYHAFINSGTFTPATSLSADVLVVAGGGGGGGYGGGAGGAGGLLAFASQALATNSTYTATVGSGGAGSTTNTSGSAGVNSSFGSLTASVGGGYGGGGNFDIIGGNGGSGGGSSGGFSSAYKSTGGTATSGQGNTGGGSNYVTINATPGGGGGGGGAGASPSPLANTGNNGQAGGAGTNSVTNWGALSAVLTATGLGVSGYIAGGGGGSGNNVGTTSGGTGGSGGGGLGGHNQTSPVAGTDASVNTGSGGGGAYYGANAGNGGSGIVIVRYTV